MKRFQSIDAFRYVWWNWKVVGLNPNTSHKFYSKIYIGLTCTIGMVIPSILQLTQSFLASNYGEIVSNLSLSLEWTCNCLKHIFIVPWFNQIMSSHGFLERIDERICCYNDEQSIMLKIVKNCRRLYIGYNVTFITTLIFFAVNAAINKKILYDSYFPWDWESSTKKYLLTIGFQLATSFVQMLACLAVDNFPLCYVYIMWGHLETLAIRISRIGHDTTKSLDDNYKELIECVLDHRNMYRYFELIRPVISGTVLIQFMVTAFALCMAIFDYLFLGSNLAKLLKTLSFVAVLFMQIIPCCYFVNDLMTSSDQLTTALYSSNWIEQTQKFRKTIIIFMQRTQKTTIIMAGNLIPVKLQTCISIIRLSFSMFILLQEMS